MTSDLISVDQAKTLYGLFLERVSSSPHDIAFRSYSEQTQSWYDLTWHEAAEQIAKWQKALLSSRLEPGDRVALNLRNCKEWVFFDQAAMGLGLVVVPLYPDDRPDSVAYILKDAGVKLLLLQNNTQWKKLEHALQDEQLKHVIIFNEEDEPLTSKARYLTDWLPAQPLELIQTRAHSDSLASIIYTSGTTGRPKGVMLSHRNMLSVASSSLAYFDVQRSDLLLSFLPLSHTFERTAGYYLAVMAGATIAYARGIPQLVEDLKVQSPTILFAVPRVFERIQHRLKQQLAKKSFISRLLFNLNVNIGWAYFNYSQGRQRWRPDFLLLPILNKVIASKLHHAMGGKLRLAISGGAALPFSTAKLFIGLGFNLLQGYGLTETSPVISVNQPENNFPNSVGRAIPDVEVKIGENQELLVKGPGNMLGYWNNHNATTAMIQSDGWLHTGDQVRISSTGHIYIIGRIKEILVLNNGEKVSPVDLETAILDDLLFEQVLILGEGQAFLAAIIVINEEQWFTLAKQLKLPLFDKQSLQRKELHQFVIKRLRVLLHDFPAYAKIRRLILTLDPWTIENGLLTPTMKLKRPAVMAHYATEIDELFHSN